MIYWLILIIALLAIGFVIKPKHKEVAKEYLDFDAKTKFVNSVIETGSAVDVQALSDLSYRQKFVRSVNNVRRQLGAFAEVKFILFSIVAIIFSLLFNSQFFRAQEVTAAILGWLLLSVLGFFWLRKRERNQFEEAFPDALSMLASAISSGESITHAIIYVGNTLQGDVGQEFKKMGQRLQVGESIDSVFRKSCQRFPYPSFYFFVITLRANMQRGGQLKDVITRLNRVMFDSRAMEKKKYALTSEARASAKIVAAMPFLFLIYMRFMIPDSYNFIMFDPEGKSILYYLLVSESLGLGMIWWLMKGATD